MNNNRRNFLKTFILSVGALAFAPILKIQQVFGAPVDLNSPLVKALGYVPNAKDSKDRKDKKALCKNCNYFQADAKAKTGPCQLMAGADVQAEGWCKSWAAKAKK